jgi:small GTP-binding protein
LVINFYLFKEKMILIGNGGVGKTCLVKRWLDHTFDEKEPSTHAIQLRRHFLKQLAKEQGFDDIQLQIWDFGGQDIYHATHRLFMQTRALFILVWDQQTENALSQTEKLNDNSEITYQNYPLLYWLDYAQNLGNNSPILIVQTKKDRDKKCEIKNWNFLKENYNKLSLNERTKRSCKTFSLCDSVMSLGKLLSNSYLSPP